MPFGAPSAAAQVRQHAPALQRAVGNQAVLRMLSRPAPALQTKLTINQPGDRYEQEADRVAEQVMRMPESAAAPDTRASGKDEVNLLRKCAECEKEEKLQRKEIAEGTGLAPPIVHEILRSPGQPLDTSARAFFEPRFGYDFRQVRVHHDAKAAGSCGSVNALAYTVGRNVVFGAGQYQPNTRAGRLLLAHELAHVAQSHSQTSDSILQRFASKEHQKLGEEAFGEGKTDLNVGNDTTYTQSGTKIGPPEYLSYGEMVALAGDYFGSLEEMRDLAKTPFGRAQIRWARWWALDGSSATEPLVGEIVKKAVKDRYYTLASGNISHFSGGGTADATYQAQHREALRLAFRTGIDSARLNQSREPKDAWTQEAFAQHFLSDMFSAGHVRVERQAIKDWYAKNMPIAMTQFKIIAYMAHYLHGTIVRRHNVVEKIPIVNWAIPSEGDIANLIKQLGGKALESFSLGDIVSLAWHNADSQGLDVFSAADPSGTLAAGGKKWRAVGDAMLDAPSYSGIGQGQAASDTKKMTLAAMRVSLAEVNTMVEMGRQAAPKIPPREPLAWLLSFTEAVGRLQPFAAERFIPKADSSSQNPQMVWEWGWMNDAMYNAVDIAVKTDVARQIREMAKQKTGDAHDALMDFANHLEIMGVLALENAFGQPARIPRPHHYGLFGEPRSGAP
ncbi:MAG TPA: DUF4157 domain-containing protein [Terriglobales bacterium]|nr:DUF4157 domain-containing protein [Terriglobales bacterium]